MINAYVKGQSLKLTYGQLVADSVNYIELAAYFLTDEWNRLDKYVHFQKGETRIDIPLVNDRVSAEWGLNLDAGTWEVWLHGSEIVNGTFLVTRITTEPQRVMVAASGSGGMILPIQPPELAETMLAHIGDLSELTTTAKDSLVNAINEVAEMSSDGVVSHADLTDRDLADQHPTSAITGLDAALAEMEQSFNAGLDALSGSLESTEIALGAEIDEKQPKGDYLTADDVTGEATEGSEKPISSGAVYTLIGGANELIVEIRTIVGSTT